MVQILHNNYKIPIYQIDDMEDISNVLNSKEFNDIYTFYSKQFPNGSRLESLPDFEKRLTFYLYYTGQDQFLDQMNGLLYKKHVPTIQEFLKDEAYMGNSYAIIYPYWRNVLNKIFDPTNQIFECVFRGSIGSGKTTIARRGLLYSLYRICCLRKPHLLFKIAPDTVLSALMISVTLQQAQDTALKPMLEMIRNTPCFHEVRKLTAFDAFGPSDPIPFCKQGGTIRFPNNVMLSVGSNINHIVGYSVFASIFDEAEEKDATESFTLYTGLRERIRSRFLNSSLIYCALISSSKSKSGMVWEYINKIKPDDPETLLLDPAIWEVKGDALSLSGKKFWIYIGTKTHPSKVLPEEYNDVPRDKLNYIPPAGCELIEVPIEYHREFENNIEAAIQNIAGRTTDTSDRPFDDLSRLGDCPNLIPEVHLEAPLGDITPLFDKLPKELFQETTFGLQLKRYPSAPRFIHIDLASQSTSQAGFSMWHKEYIVNDLGDKDVVFVADFISWISSPNRIDHEAIKQLLFDLRDRARIRIKTVSYDQFQSEFMRQYLQQHHEFENVKYQSVDRDITAYMNFSQWIITGKIKVGDCPYLRDQLNHIGVFNKKIITTMKKDMADSCLSYDTKVFLLSGKVLTIEELYNSDISHEWILACDVDNRKLMPVKIEKVLQKYIPEKLIQFTFNNGKVLSVTNDHLLLMRNGEYKRADEIKEMDELMPFNYYHELNYHDRYRKVVNPFRGTAQFIYKLVSKELLEREINDAKQRALVDGSSFTVIHHKSHNKNDDRPENLLPLTNIEHTSLHAMTGKEIKAFHDRTVLKRSQSRIINQGLALMKRANPEGYRKYLLKHDIADQLAEQKVKVENTRVYVTQIAKIPNVKPVYDIVLNSIHNFALDCNVFVHNCVGSVNNAYLDNEPVEYEFVNTEKKETTLEEMIGINSDNQEIEEF